jgi:hypothetical protein
MPVPPQNYIYIDFENIQEVDIHLIADRPVKVVIALGMRQTNLPVEMVKALLKYPAQVELVEVGVQGKNALDFVLAYYIGQQTLQDPKGYFHILSRDKGFDSLVEHLRDQKKISIRRHERFADIEVLKNERFLKPADPAEKPSKTAEIRIVKPPVAAPSPRPPATPAPPKANPRVVVKATPSPKATPPPAKSTGSADRFILLKENLVKNAKNRPARKAALLSHIRHFFGNTLSEPECEKVMQRLIADGVISVNPQNQVEYQS